MTPAPLPAPESAWDALPFALDEYANRIDMVKREMREQKLDALVVTAPDNIYYLTGYNSLGYYQFQAMVFELNREEPWGVFHEVERGSARISTWVTDLQFWKHNRQAAGSADGLDAVCERLERTLPARARVGLDLDGYFFSISNFQRLATRLPQFELCSTGPLVPRIRAVKSPAEVAYLRQAAAHSDQGMLAAARAAVIGATENDVKAAADLAMTPAGSEYACLPPMISSGPKTLAVHQSSSARVIEDGDPVTVGLAGSVRRYNSNLLRTFLPLGSRPNPGFAAAYELLVEATARCIAIAGPGVPGAELDRESRRVTQEFDKYRLHRTGYGLEAGYPPSWIGSVSLSVDDPTILQPGMVVTVEPTFIFYDREGAEGFSAIMGNNILITETGAETLNQVSPFLNQP